MLYMPVSTAATPVVLSDRNVSVPLQPNPGYYLLQSSTVVPGVPVFNTTYVYPRYGFIPKPVENSVTKEEVEKIQTTNQPVEAHPVVQHVVHHHVRPYSQQSCPGFCELCCPWEVPQNTTVPHREQQQQPSSDESLDERIERVRRELNENSSSDRVIHHIHYPDERSETPPPAPRQPWRSTNQNEYPWRDSHLPGYRQAALSRSQTNLNETAHERSHRNTSATNRFSHGKEYVYRPKSEVEAKKWYQISTGKDPDREVQQSLQTNHYGSKTTQTMDRSDYGFRSMTAEHPISLAGERFTKVDSTHYHDLYASRNSNLHVVPKNGASFDAPQMKIINAPVTYIH